MADHLALAMANLHDFSEWNQGRGDREETAENWAYRLDATLEVLVADYTQFFFEAGQRYGELELRTQRYQRVLAEFGSSHWCEDCCDIGEPNERCESQCVGHIARVTLQRTG